MPLIAESVQALAARLMTRGKNRWLGLVSGNPKSRRGLFQVHLKGTGLLAAITRQGPQPKKAACHKYFDLNTSDNGEQYRGQPK